MNQGQHIAPTEARTPAAQPQAAPADEVLLGRYRVLARRGTGGFGTVCTCWDTRLQRRVAIKRLPILAESGTTTATEALAEARTACMLGHPNIVTVFDFESDGAYAYLVMEYVDGLNLAELLARVEGGRLTCEECAHVLGSVSRALAFAHENRVLHLDIKPANIMIDRQGTVKLADFGMSTLASAAGYGDARGGTVGYMPPEQVEGRTVDERADVFALAVVVWQSLTGQDPFAAPTAQESLSKIRRGPARPLSKDRPELSGAAEQVLLDAMAPMAADRTASVGQMADSLLFYLGSPTQGSASLRGLVEQSERDDDTETTTWEQRHLPLELRFPWLGTALARAVTALVAFAACHLALPALPGATEQFVAVASLVVAAAGAAWPPLGSALAGSSLVLALASAAPTNASFPLAAVTAAALAAWWVRVGRTEHLASAALLLPWCLPSPVAGAGLAGFALDPLPAAATGTAGYLLGSLFHLAAREGFSASATLAALVPTWVSPGFWACVAGAATCAALSSAVALRGSVAAGVAGQALGLGCIVFFEVVAARMENGGVLSPSNWESIFLAVLLTVLLCIATVLRGPLFEDREGEDFDELPQ